MRKIVVLIVAAALSAPALSAPTYLKCQVALAGTGLRHFDVNLNEAEENAGFTMVEGGWSVQKRPAVFAPDKVSWSFPDIVADRTITISRTTLDFFAHENGVSDSDWTGHCVIPKKEPKAKF